MAHVKESCTIGGKEITLETGKMAKQAGGSVIVSIGDTMVMVTACGSKGPREGMNFMPLTCEYQEKFYAAGKVPGSFFRREGRPAEREVLVCRLMDRPIRPLFPDGWRIDTQVIANVLSFDRVNPSDVLAITGASVSLTISDLVWAGPLAGIRVGRVNGAFVAYPTFEEQEDSDLDLIVVASRDAIVMVEGGMSEMKEEDIIDAILFGHESIQPLLDAQERLREKVGKTKRIHKVPEADKAVESAVREIAMDKIAAALAVREKHARYAALDDAKAWLKGELCSEGKPFEGRDSEVSEAYGAVKKDYARSKTIDKRERIDGRAPDAIREISCEVGVLPMAHGSALFTRGETQTLVAATLGTRYDEKRLDTLLGDIHQKFYLHYNFPPFCVGETKMMRGTSRREIGHGNLAERSVRQVMPEHSDFPYTVRVVSEVLESNGSSSMASVCGGSLALMDCGVPTTGAVAGIAMGLMSEGDKYAILSDILGDEDHMGDMDFKVTGTKRGITALQMDIKLDGLSRDIMVEALGQAKAGRLHILDEMAKALSEARDDLSPNAPRIETVQVSPDKIRDIIGPGGKTIRAIQEQTGAKIDIDDTGKVSIASANGKSLQQAIDFINGLTQEPEIGVYYRGLVRRCADFGAFVEIMPGTDGLVHISELAADRTNRVTDVVEEGDEIIVKCINIDREGKVRLSRKQALDVDESEVENYLTS